MDLYHVMLFAHILGAVVLVGQGFLVPLLNGAIRRTATVSSLKEWIGLGQKLAKTGGPAAGLVLVSGLYMGITAHSFRQGWLAVSLVLFLIGGGLATGVIDPMLGRFMAAAEAAPAGVVPPELRATLMSPKLHVIESALFGMDLAIVFLMTNKPGWGGALTATAVGLAIAAGRVAFERRRHGQPTPVPAA